MFYKRYGLPEEGELLLCTVTNIQYSSVFVRIDEYRISGMIHISEIAAGRIRNIRDYVKEGKKVVCKVLRVHEQKGHVDLSLRRVNESQRRNKVNEIKLEQKAESIITYVAKQNKEDPQELYNKIAEPILKEYEYVHHAFEDLVEGNFDASKIGKYAEPIEELVRQRFKPKMVEISGEMELSSYDSNGVEVVREALKKAASDDSVDLQYLGGGRFKISYTAADYKTAEPKLKKVVAEAIKHVTKHKGSGKFTRAE